MYDDTKKSFGIETRGGKDYVVQTNLKFYVLMGIISLEGKVPSRDNATSIFTIIQISAYFLRSKLFFFTCSFLPNCAPHSYHLSSHIYVYINMKSVSFTARPHLPILV